MKTNVLEHIVLAPLPENLKVKSDHHNSEFISPWLKKEDAGVLTFKFNKIDFDVNLNIPLDDGSLLTSPKNKDLFLIVKRWIHLQHYPRSKRQLKIKNKTAQKKLWAVLRSLDKIMLHSQSLLIHKHGFGQVTSGTANGFIDDFINSNNAHDSIYEWPIRLSNYLIEKINAPLGYDYHGFVEKYPIFLEPIAEKDDRILAMTDEQIFRARVWLYHNDLYKKSEWEAWPGHVMTGKLVKIFYPHCTMADHMRPLSYELEIQLVNGHLRELPQIPVREEKPGATELRYNEFCASLTSQKYLPPSPLNIPELTIRSLENNDLKSKLATLGTFVTLPHVMTITSLQKAVLFFEQESDRILNYLAGLIKGAADKGVHPSSFHLTYNSISNPNGDAFKIWDLYTPTEITKSQDSNNHAVHQMRKMEGVLQAYYTLLGSIQYTIGFFTARRQSELLKMKFEHVFADQNYIATSVMKTGIGEERLTFDLPTIPIVTRMLTRLKNFFTDCGLEEAVVQKSQCFGRISIGRRPRVITSGVRRYNSHLDVFCDYIRTDTVDGHRYYVRQHQLRRAFAIGFFYLNPRGNLSVLSYYFGHMDFKQIYRYLTSVVGNKEMLDIKAAYLAEQSLEDSPAAAELLKKLGALSHQTILKVHERDRLQIYYRSLLKRNDINVEPTFLALDGFDKTLISIKVKNARHG